MKFLEEALQGLKDADLYRELKTLSSAPEAHVTLGGRSFINFASNNYLGLSADERVKSAAAEAAREWGAGATASRLLGGTLELHDELERSLAAFKRTEACAVFPSGYHANLGTLQCLLSSDDTALVDRLAHASLIDGVRLSRATLRVFRHNDPSDLEKKLRGRGRRGRVWIITESVFSMDGDVAPLAEIVGLARRYGAHTYVDEAHGTGVWGPEGRGVVNECGLEKDVDVCMGTLSKALGSAGGFVCGGRSLIEWIRNRSRSFIYSTALPPPSLAAALKSLELVQQEPWRRKKLFDLTARLRAGLRQPESLNSPIVPFLVGSEKETLRLSRLLWDEGIFAPAIRPPTVPKGTSRLRFSLTAGHTEADVDRVVGCLLEKSIA